MLSGLTMTALGSLANRALIESRPAMATASITLARKFSKRLNYALRAAKLARPHIGYKRVK